jgi:hypothetical protein
MHAKTVLMEQMTQLARFQGSTNDDQEMYMYNPIQMFPTRDDITDKKKLRNFMMEFQCYQFDVLVDHGDILHNIMNQVSNDPLP